MWVSGDRRLRRSGQEQSLQRAPSGPAFGESLAPLTAGDSACLPEVLSADGGSGRHFVSGIRNQAMPPLVSGSRGQALPRNSSRRAWPSRAATATSPRRNSLEQRSRGFPRSLAPNSPRVKPSGHHRNFEARRRTCIRRACTVRREPVNRDRYAPCGGTQWRQNLEAGESPAGSPALPRGVSTRSRSARCAGA